MNKMMKRLSQFLGVILCLATVEAFAHVDVTPHPLDTSTLPPLGKDWVANPYRGNAEAIAVGAVGYLHNCAGCHGLNAVSGGIAPDLLKAGAVCIGMSASSQASCWKDTDDFFKDIVLEGKKTSDGRATMPAYNEVFTQEAVWALKAYVDKRTAEVNGK